MLSAGQRTYFSEWLQTEMDKRGWSQSDLARSAGLNRAVVNKILNGKSHPQPPTLEAISRAFKIPVEAIYRAAGLLSVDTEHDDIADEAFHILKNIQNPQRRATVITLLRALVAEEENERKAEKAK